MPAGDVVRRERHPARVRDVVLGGAGHPLVAVLPLLRDTLVSVADETTHLMIVTDARGRILWRAAPRRAARIPRAGHLGRTRHSWSCAACPIHDPGSGAVVGAVDVTGPARMRHPSTLALVEAVARLAEGHLAAQLAMHDGRLIPRSPPARGRKISS